MTKRIIPFALAAILALPAGCSSYSPPAEKPPENTGENAPSGYTLITPELAKKELDENPGTILIDLRTETEHTNKRIEGSICIPYFELENKLEELIGDKNAKIIVYGTTKKRSAESAAKMAELGYSGVRDMGAFTDWPYESVGEG